MNIKTIILLGLVSVPFSAGAAWLIGKLDLGWTARQRVFNAAAIPPTIVSAGAACFAGVLLSLGDHRKFAATNEVLLQAITAILAMYISGLIAAYLVERMMTK